MRINSATQSNQTSAASAPRRASAAGTVTLEETGTAGKGATRSSAPAALRAGANRRSICSTN